MLPDKSNPKWKQLVTGELRPSLQSLPAKMLLTSLMINVRVDQGDEKVVSRSVDELYQFFRVNQETIKEDIRTIFG